MPFAHIAAVIALQPISPIDRTVRAEAPSASIYSFVPAGSADCARTAVRQLSEAMRAYLAVEDDSRTVLLANFLDSQAEQLSSITCVDLEDADPAEARLAIDVSEAIFVVSATDPASLEDARAQAAWVRYVQGSLHRDDTCGLLLVPVAGGLTAAQAEESVGLPVCGVLGSPGHIALLARWIVQE
jgi:hypothetical protein